MKDFRELVIESINTQGFVSVKNSVGKWFRMDCKEMLELEKLHQQSNLYTIDTKLYEALKTNVSKWPQ